VPNWLEWHKGHLEEENEKVDNMYATKNTKRKALTRLLYKSSWKEVEKNQQTEALQGKACDALANQQKENQDHRNEGRKGNHMHSQSHAQPEQVEVVYEAIYWTAREAYKHKTYCKQTWKKACNMNIHM